MKTSTLLFLLAFFIVDTLSSNFEADATWTCDESNLSIFIKTSHPFDGIAETSHHENCRVRGIGTNVAVLRVPLTQECGIRYNETSKAFQGVVDIHFHPILIIDADKSIDITCIPHNRTSNRLDYELRLLSRRRPINYIQYSKPYTIQVRSIVKSRSYLVGRCEASSGDSKVQLTDSSGCSLFSSIITDFRRVDNVEEADIPSMFRFPNESTFISIQCQVLSCETECSNRICDRDSPVSTILERTSSESDNDDDLQTIQIKLAIKATEKDKPESLEVIDDFVDRQEATIMNDQMTSCVNEQDFKTVYYLCIALAASAIVGFSLNIVLCILLKRRSNAVKKPSIKDDKIQSKLSEDFWISDGRMEQEPADVFERQESFNSYASIKKHYGICAIDDIYRKPAIQKRSEERQSGSTFATTMETDVDSQTSSNQASSYH